MLRFRDTSLLCYLGPYLLSDAYPQEATCGTVFSQDLLDSSAARVARQPRAGGVRLARLLFRLRFTFSGRLCRRTHTLFVSLFLVRRVFRCNHKKSVEKKAV